MLPAKGRNVLVLVVVATALVMTPMILFGVYVGYYLGDVLGYPKSLLAIAFSTLGFVAGMSIIFRVIRAAVAKIERTTSRAS